MGKIEKITLGSGDLYCIDNIDTIPATISAVEALLVDTNFLGFISGGATLEYKPTFYEAKDDKGNVCKNIITEEEATLKSGILTFNANTLNKLCDTGRVSETASERVVKIGGTKNRNGKYYLLIFKYSDAVDGDAYVIIVGQNQAGFSLAFAKDKETVIDAEFKAKPMDNEGTLIVYMEEIKASESSDSSDTVEG